MSGFANPTTPNLADYQVFLTNEGFRSDYLPTSSPLIAATFNLGMEAVNGDLGLAGLGLDYSFAVYNFGADRLVNYASDVDGQTFFRDLRREFGIYKFSPGIVQSASDQGTSGNLQVIEAMRRMTLGDLQMLKTPYGRAYMAIAQSAGSDIWMLG